MTQFLPRWDVSAGEFSVWRLELFAGQIKILLMQFVLINSVFLIAAHAQALQEGFQDFEKVEFHEPIDIAGLSRA
jgi:hypothetical protein